MAMDGVREQTLLDFRKKSSCHIEQMESFSPWMNPAENGVHELKKASAQSMLKKHLSKRL